MTFEFFVNLLVMAGITYLLRAVPLVMIKRQIKNRFIRSFLYYVPYAVLGAMTFPAIFYSTDYLVSAIVGTVVACILAYFGKSLLTVSVFSCVAVFITELIIPLF
ncbi:MAG: AzlD domain-containing protein [Eubacteriales bacterium]